LEFDIILTLHIYIRKSKVFEKEWHGKKGEGKINKKLKKLEGNIWSMLK
jgi:hypothetical protein